MYKKIGIETSTTAGESQFSNRLVERNNNVFYKTLLKPMNDAKCNMETTLAQAALAKNTLQNHDGSFPVRKTVFGTNVNLPSASQIYCQFQNLLHLVILLGNN